MNVDLDAIAHLSGAERYEQCFVPALFGEWAELVAREAPLKSGDRVLDVACGTGVVARLVKQRVGDTGSVVGLDFHPEMIDVAKETSTDIEWIVGSATELPVEDGSFDATFCQFGLMFFDDHDKALREMWRVLKPGGYFNLTVWDVIENLPGWLALVGLLDRVMGPDVGNILRQPFTMGDTSELVSLFHRAGLAGFDVDTRQGSFRYPSISAWVHTILKGWMGFDGAFTDEQFAKLEAEAQTGLAQFLIEDGTVRGPVQAHIVTATKPA